jgi:hypothetical protein
MLIEVLFSFVTVSPSRWLVVFGGVNSLLSRPALQARTAERDCGGFMPPKTTQYTVNSTFSLNCKVQP